MLDKNIISPISNIYFRHKVLARILMIIMSIAFVFWLTFAVLLGLILNIEVFIKNNSPIPIEYSKQSVNYFLIPKIILKNVDFGDVESEEVRIDIDLFSLFYLKPKIKSIALLNSKVLDARNNFHAVSFYRNIISFLLKDRNAPYNIIFHGLQAKFLEKNISLTRLDIKNSTNNLLFWAQGASGFNVFSELSKGDNAEFKLLINAKDYNLKILQNDGLDMPKSAKLEFDTGNIAKIFNPSNAYPAIMANQESKIIADISFKNDNLEINNIVLTGQTLNGSARLIFGDTVFNLEANLQNLNVNDFFAADGLAKNFIEGNIDQIIPDKHDVDVQLKIANLFVAKEQVKDFNFAIKNSAKNNFILKDFSGNFSDQGAFRVQGLVDHNQYRFKFDGGLQLTHSDLNNLLINFDFIENKAAYLPVPFALNSDISLTNARFALQNLNAALGKSQIKGDLAFRIFGDNLHLESMIKANDLQTNDILPLVKDALGYFDIIAFDSQKDHRKFIPIRANRTLMNLNLKFENLKYKDTHFSNASFLVDIVPSAVLLNSCTLLNENIYLSGQASLDVKTFQPVYKINIKRAKLPPVSFDYLVYLQDNLLKKLDLDNVILQFNLKIPDLDFLNTKLKNFEFIADVNNSAVSIEKISFNGLGGSAFANAVINVKPFVANLGYTYNNLNLASIFANSLILNDISGVISTSGSLNFTGDTWAERFYSLKLDGKILGRNIIVKNLGIDNLLNNMLQTNYQQSNLANDLNYFANKGSTKFNTINGQYSVNTGIMDIKKIEFSTDQSKGLLYGTLDAYKQQVDLTGAFNFSVNQQSSDVSQITFKVMRDIFNPQKTLQFRENIPLSNGQ